MTATRPGALSAIGNTPLVRLSGLVDDDCAEVWVKLEAANPTGSYKDRMALAMIEAAERDGRLQPGQLVVESSAGSTGSSLAMVCAVKGYPLRIVTSDAFAPEKLATMRALGAELEIIPSPGGTTPELIPAMARRATQIAADTGALLVDQFHNEDMIGGFSTIADELLEQLPSAELDAWVSYIGTAGCFVGVTRALRKRLPEVLRIGVEPAESPVLSGGEAGTHRIEGGGIGKWPPLLDPADLDEVLTVSEADAFAHARDAARTEGIFSGPSTGANLAAAVRFARRLGPGRRVATVQVDSGLKYLGGEVYSAP